MSNDAIVKNVFSVVGELEIVLMPPIDLDEGVRNFYGSHVQK